MNTRRRVQYSLKCYQLNENGETPDYVKGWLEEFNPCELEVDKKEVDFVYKMARTTAGLLAKSNCDLDSSLDLLQETQRIMTELKERL